MESRLIQLAIKQNSHAHSSRKLLDATELEPDARQYLNYRFRLDISQLPRPFQIAAGNQSDWALSVSRTLRLQPER